MARDERAATQYSDLTGTIALDGYGSGFLYRFAGRIREGYLPVGLRLSAEEPAKDGQIIATLWAVDTSVVGAGADAIRAHATRNAPVPVVPFKIDLQFDELITLIKRCEIELKSCLLGETQIAVQEDCHWFGGDRAGGLPGPSRS